MHAAVSETGVPEPTVRGAMCVTVGAVEAFTVMVTVAVDEPTALVTVSANVSCVEAPTCGATKLGLAIAGSDSATAGPAVCTQAKVNGAVPVALPASVTTAADATV